VARNIALRLELAAETSLTLWLDVPLFSAIGNYLFDNKYL
jgi:hypothetical protein